MVSLFQMHELYCKCYFPSSFYTKATAVEKPRPSENPCINNPCGPFSQCRAIGDTPACSCLPNYVGRAPNCRPECIISAECPSNLACINQKCSDPCVGACGAHTFCTAINHNSICQCEQGYTGDPFSICTEIRKCKLSPFLPVIIHRFLFFSNFHIKKLFDSLCQFILCPIKFIPRHSVTKSVWINKLKRSIKCSVPPVMDTPSPCANSPCGANAVCKERNGVGSCACLPEYYGDPYTGCRPECVQNPECDQTRACVNNKCVDPCPGVCPPNASKSLEPPDPQTP